MPLISTEQVLFTSDHIPDSSASLNSEEYPASTVQKPSTPLHTILQDGHRNVLFPIEAHPAIHAD